MKNRLDWIDNARGIGIFCVYLYHTGYSTPYRYCFEYFLIPIFFFVSGYLFNENRSVTDSLSRIKKRLFIPYLILGFIIGLKPSNFHEDGIVSAVMTSIKRVVLGEELLLIYSLICVEIFTVILIQIIGRMKFNINISKSIIMTISFSLIIFTPPHTIFNKSLW